jgi:hypothetical protein
LIQSDHDAMNIVRLREEFTKATRILSFFQET